MGDAAYERAATPEEIDRMCQLVGEAMDAGAAGLSTSFSFAHRGVDGKPVPSRFAEMDEVEALFMAAGKAGKGVVLTTPGWQCEYPDIFTWQPRVGRPFTCPLFALSSGKHREVVQMHEEALARGANVWPQVTPRPLTMQFTLADAYNLNVGEVFGELIKVSPAVRKAAFRDQEWRTRAYEDLEGNEGGMKPRWETFEVSESERFPELLGRRVTDIARERGVSPLDVMCELALAEDLATRFRAYIANDDRGGGGAPAHRGPRGAGSDRRRRPRGPAVRRAAAPPTSSGPGSGTGSSCPLERAVRKLAGEPADMFGFEGRGYLRPGYAADICVFDPATVAPGPQRRLRDLPADGERLTNEEPTGVRHVMVNGTLIRTDERQLELEQRPGTRPRLV